MLRKTFTTGLLALTLLTIVANERVASAQPALDRVLDRVGQELDRVLPPQDAQPAANPRPEEVALPGEVEPGYLGVLADDRTEEGQGVRITGVLPGTPAAVGKLAVNDLILAINGRPIRTMDEMARILSAFPAGDEVNFSVMRDGRPAKVVVVLGKRPGVQDRPFANFGAQPEAVEAVPAERPKLGVRTVPVNDQTRARLQLPNNEGAVVIAISAGSVAEQLGLQLGSVITQVNGTVVKSPEQLVELVGEAADTGTLQMAFVQDGQEIVHEVPFGAAPAQPAAFAQPAAGDAADSVDVDEMTELEAYLDALERRVRDLEDRVAQLEGALAEKNAAQPANAALETQNEADLDAATDRAAEDE